MKMFGLDSKKIQQARVNCAVGISCLAMAFAIGCGGPQPAAESPELARLRLENEEVQRLKRENAELARLRRDQEEVGRLRKQLEELVALQKENEQLRGQISQKRSPGPVGTAAAPAENPPRRQPITNIAQAFEQAAGTVPLENIKEEDLPREGDRLLIDQSVIGLLIPEFEGKTNGGPYEVSGWLKGHGVNLRNYQQLTVLGLTNYQVLRAPPKLPQ